MKREWLDNLLQRTIRLVMLTGVAFTVTACYGAPPERWHNEPITPEEQEQVDQLLTEVGLAEETICK